MRRLFTVIYWLMSIGVAASVAGSATWGAFATPRLSPGDAVSPGVTPDSPEGRECARSLKGLYDELVDRAGQTFLGDGGPSPDLLGDWSGWSTQWHARLQDRRLACRLREAPAMAPLARLANNLERLHLAYTTALTGFSDVGRRQLVEAKAAFGDLGLQ